MLKNIASLYVLQFVSYLIPLALTPYIARTLGVSNFGVLGICGTVVAYASLLSNWGFDLSASQKISQFADDRDKLRAIFWDTLLAKLTLGCLGLVILGLGVGVSRTLRDHWPTMLASSLALIGSMFSVNWFLQGLEKMGVFALASLCGRLITLPLTFMFVHSAKDTALAAAIQGGALCLSATASLCGALTLADLFPMRVNVGGAYDQIRDGFRLFLSTAAISLYTYTNLLAVGFIAGPSQAGLFDGADRLKRAGQSLTGPIGNAMFPRINHMMSRTRERVPSTMIWLLVAQGALSLILSVGLFITAPGLTVLFLGRSYAGAIPITQWLSINVFLIGVSNVLGINIMLPLGMKRAFTSIVVGSGILNLVLLILLTTRGGALGAAESVTITELIVTVSMAVWLMIQRRKFWGADDQPPLMHEAPSH